MTKKLEEIRRRIDQLDNHIHDLLMERAGLIVDVSEEKRKSGLQVVQPAREALMIRRLLGRHQGRLPRPAIVRIWRELVGAVCLLQTGLKVAVTVPDGRPHFWDMAKDYFGSVLPMQRVSNPLAAIGMVREGEANFAVVPWPEDGGADPNPWWLYLLNGEEGSRMQVVVRLPYGDIQGEAPDVENMALIVSGISFDPTGDDRSFLAIETDQSVSRARIVELAAEAGIDAVSMYSRKLAGQPSDTPADHLIEVEGFVTEGDERLARLSDRLEGVQARIVCVGGYPRPPVYENTDVQACPPGAQPVKK